MSLRKYVNAHFGGKLVSMICIQGAVSHLYGKAKFYFYLR